MVTWESLGDFIVMPPGGFLQSSSQIDFSEEFGNDVQLRILISEMRDVTFLFTTVTMTLLTFVTSSKPSHRLAALLGYYLSTTPLFYNIFFWVLAIDVSVRKLIIWAC